MLTEFQTKVKQAIQLGCTKVIYDEGTDITAIDFTGPNGLDLIFNLNLLKQLHITKNITDAFNGIYLCINEITLSGNIMNSFINTVMDFQKFTIEIGTITESFLKNIMTGCELKMTNPIITGSWNNEIFTMEKLIIEIATTLSSSFNTFTNKGTSFNFTYTGTNAITNTFVNVNLIDYYNVDLQIPTVTVAVTASFNLWNIESKNIIINANVIGDIFAYTSIVGAILSFKNTSVNTSGIIFNNSNIILKDNFDIEVNQIGEFLKSSHIIAHCLTCKGIYMSCCDNSNVILWHMNIEGSITISLLSQSFLKADKLKIQLNNSVAISIMTNSKIVVSEIIHFINSVFTGSSLFENSKITCGILCFEAGLLQNTIWTNCILNSNQFISHANIISSGSNGTFNVKDKICIHGDLTLSFNNAIIISKNIFATNIINSFEESTVQSKIFVVNEQLDCAPKTKFFIDRLKLKSYISASEIVYTNLGYLDLDLTVIGNEYIELIENAQFGRTIVFLIVNENTIGVFSQGQFYTLCELVLAGTASVLEVPLEILEQINKIEVRHKLTCDEQKRLDKYCLKNSWKGC